MAGKHGLGRGLASLIPQKKSIEKESSSEVSHDDALTREQRTKSSSSDNVRDTASASPTEQAHLPKNGEMSVCDVPINKIVRNSQQPRLYFNAEKIAELSDSIKEHGILQPLIVIENSSGYELIAGERRFRAAEDAGLSHVPVIVREALSEQKKLELAIIENVQRHDLNVVEEAKSYKKLADEFHLSQEEIATRTGKSRSAIANRMRLTNLPIEIQRGLIEEKISEGHAKIILSFENAEKQRAVYEAIIARKMSVRDTEKFIAGAQGKNNVPVAAHTRHAKSPQTQVLEDQLAAYFGTPVRVAPKAKGGTITLRYFSDEDLKTILSKLTL